MVGQLEYFQEALIKLLEIEWSHVTESEIDKTGEKLHLFKMYSLKVTHSNEIVFITVSDILNYGVFILGIVVV